MLKIGRSRELNRFDYNNEISVEMFAVCAISSGHEAFIPLNAIMNPTAIDTPAKATN